MHPVVHPVGMVPLLADLMWLDLTVEPVKETHEEEYQN